MTLAYLILSVVIVLGAWWSRSRKGIATLSIVYFVLQAAFVGWILWAGRDTTELHFFTYDNLGALFHTLMAVISPIVFYQSINYLNTETVREYKIYSLSLILLCMALTGVYYANNAAVTWIFLEATTLATAGLVYHRRSIRSLEATWKYIFVSSVGIAVAYLGILMLSTAVTGEESLNYGQLRSAMAGANPLYMKMAFLFILTGYSCKMEVFPLYTVGVDANYAAPTPASALISTGLVNAGFIAFFRIYRVLQESEVYEWMKSVLILTGLISVIIGAIYLRRTNNFKRLLAYSTVENLGIALIGLGIGGAGVYAAVLHLIVHSLLKSGMFMQIAQVGRIFGTYRMNRIGNYWNLYSTGATVILLGMIGLLAFPPSGLFVSELMILKELAAGGRWITLAIFVLTICVIIYTLARRFSSLLWKPVDTEKADVQAIRKSSTWLQFILILLALVLGLVQPQWLVDFIQTITG